MTCRRRQLDRLFCDQVLATYSRLRTIRGTARQLGTTDYFVNKALRYCGVRPDCGAGPGRKRANRRSEAQYAYLRQLRDAGIPVKDIARENGVSTKTVYRATSKLGRERAEHRDNIVDQVHRSVFYSKSLEDLAESMGLTHEQLMRKYLSDFPVCRARNIKRTRWI